MHTQAHTSAEITMYHKAKCILARVIKMPLNLDGRLVPSTDLLLYETRLPFSAGGCNTKWQNGRHFSTSNTSDKGILLFTCTQTQPLPCCPSSNHTAISCPNATHC